MSNLNFDASVDANSFFQTINQMNQQMGKLADAVNKANTPLNNVEESIRAVNKSAGESQSKVGGFVSELLPIASIGAAVATMRSLSVGIIEVTAEFQKYQAVLTNTLGSQDEANKVMMDLQTFAAQTPFALSELTGAYVKLTNYGLQPTMEQMRQYGDLAASVGKGFDQLAEAAADAVSGNFERLQEFGIKASKEGEKITFTFKEQPTVVQNSAAEIEKYLASLGDMKGVKGGMEAISKTIGGQISNLQDNIDKMFNSIGQANSGLISDVIGGASTIVEHYEEVIKIIGILVATYGAYKAAIMVTAAVQKATAIAGNVTAWFELAKGIKTAKDAQLAFNLASKANPVGLIVAAISGLVLAFTLLHKSTKTATEAQEEYNKLKDAYSGTKADADLIARYEALEKLKESQGLNNEQQLEYNKLLDQLSQKMPGAIEKYDDLSNVIKLNTEDLKKLNEADITANSIVAKKKIEEDVKALTKLEEKAKKQQDIFMGPDKVEKTVVNPYGMSNTVTVDMSGAKEDAAKKYKELKVDIDKYKESISGTAAMLGEDLDEAMKKRILALEVKIEPIAPTSEETEKIKATVSQQIKTINSAISEAEKELKSMRLSTSTATPEDIEAAEKNIKGLKDKLASLTGISKKEAAKASEQAAEGSIKSIEEKIKKLQDKQFTFTSPEKEAENVAAINVLLEEVEKKKLEIAQRIRDDQFSIIPKITEKEVSEVNTTDEQKLVSDAYSKLGLSQAKTLTDEQKKQLNIEIQKAKESKEASKFNLATVKQMTNEQAAQLKGEKQRVDKAIDFRGAIQDGLGDFSEMALTSADIGNALFDAVSVLDEGLGESGKKVADIVGQAGVFAENLASQNWVGAIVSGLGLVGQVLDLNKENQKEIVEKQIEYNQLLQEQVDLLIESGIISQNQGSTEALRQLMEEYDLYKQTMSFDVVRVDVTGYDDNMNEIKRSFTDSLKSIMNEVYGEDWGATELLDAQKNFTGVMEQYMKSLEGSMWNSDVETWNANIFNKEKLVEYVNGLTEIETKMKQVQETFVGFTNSDLIDSIVDGINEGLQLSEDGLGGFADSFEELMKKAGRNAILTSFNDKYYQLMQQQMIEAMSLNSQSGKIVTEEELAAMRETYRTGIEYGQEMASNWAAVLGDMGDVTKEYNSAKGSIQGITEKTAGVLEGSISSIQYNVIGMKALIDKQIVHLAEIAHNTSYNFHLQDVPRLVNSIRETNRLLNEIKNTDTTGNNYGL